jgi:hypothetical protein
MKPVMKWFYHLQHGENDVRLRYNVRLSIDSVSLLLKSMRSISRDVMSSGILLCINKINYKELFIIFGLYLDFQRNAN